MLSSIELCPSTILQEASPWVLSVFQMLDVSFWAAVSTSSILNSPSSTSGLNLTCSVTSCVAAALLTGLTGAADSPECGSGSCVCGRQVPTAGRAVSFPLSPSGHSVKCRKYPSACLVSQEHYDWIILMLCHLKYLHFVTFLRMI